MARALVRREERRLLFNTRSVVCQVARVTASRVNASLHLLLRDAHRSPMMRKIPGRVTVEQKRVPSYRKCSDSALIIRTRDREPVRLLIERVLWDTYVSAWHNDGRSWSAQRLNSLQEKPGCSITG